MTAKIISVDGLSKAYLVRHQQQRRESYIALREVMTRGVSSFVRKTINMACGRPLAEGDEVEEFWALKGVSFEVAKGEVVGVIGRNGAGKSTLLKILSRITEPTSGRVILRGRVASLLEVGTGFHPELTGRENVFLNGAVLGMSRAEIRRKFAEIVEFAEVEKFLDTPVKRYSSGMYVRLAFAVAAHLDPEILVIDEVLAVGDAVFQEKCLGKMKDVAKNEGRTVLFVSHQLSTISQLCSRCILIQNGEVVADGVTSTTIERYLQRADPTVSEGRIIFERVAGKAGQVTEVCLKNERGEVCNRFSCDEAICVEVLFCVQQRVPGMYCWVDFTRLDGMLVWMNDSHDAAPNILGDLVPGDYALRIHVPGRSVGHGKYLLNLVFTGPEGGASCVDALESICAFAVDDLTTRRGNGRPGFLSAVAKWSLNPVHAFKR